MCIVLLTTSHPDYALIVIDNRDEFILRPTSRPHWWTPASPPAPEHPSHPIDVLSSRDLQRPEKGTWLGITRRGNFAVLTNYREDGPQPSVAGARSRGAIVTAWLGADPAESTEAFVHRMLATGETKGMGGLSLICGKLRPRGGTTTTTTSTGTGAKQNGTAAPPKTQALDPLAIISNRSDGVDDVPWICGERGHVYGLSNTCYAHPDHDAAAGTPLWPKVADGIALLEKAMAKVAEGTVPDEAALEELLFGILDTDTFPRHPGMRFQDQVAVLKDSIFIPPIGDEKHLQEMEAAVRNGHESKLAEAEGVLKSDERPDQQGQGFMTGLYGTQRQTVILVDWDGNVTYKERALWDASGNPLPPGEGDLTFKYRIDGWDSE